MKIAIIGSGPGGTSAAKAAAKSGAEVTLIEQAEIGGLCLNEGCIPSKTLLEYGRLIHKLKYGLESGILTGNAAINWKALQDKRLEVIANLKNQLKAGLNSKNLHLLSGNARFISPNKLEVVAGDGSGTLDFDQAIIATGSEPIFPGPLQELKAHLMDSAQALEISRVPDNVIVIGGGAVGCEMACLWSELGSEVTVIEKTANLLPGEDKNVVETLERSFKTRGMKVLTQTEVTGISKNSNGFELKLSGGLVLQSNSVTVCIGRNPRIRSLVIESAGVKMERNYIPVDKTLRTNCPHIFAIGDVNGLSKLAHAAAFQGEIAGKNAATGANGQYDGALVPRCLYTWPEVASIGQSPQEAGNNGKKIKTQRFFFSGSSKARASGETEGFIQIVTNSSDNRILGAQIIGPEATELIHIFVIAIHAGMTQDNLREIMFAHPTLAEGIREAINKY